MKWIAQVAVLLSLVKKLVENHSWCGETHIQKAAYILKDMLATDFSYEFILYKHGPYSFDLSDELVRLRADGLVKVIPKDPYGPSILLSANGENLIAKFPKTLGKEEKKIDFVAEWFGGKKVAELERLATAWYVTSTNEELVTLEFRAKKLVELKPHVSLAEAEAALQEVGAKWQTTSLLEAA